MVEFAVAVPLSFPAEGRLGVSQTGELPEFGQIWVWDMLYAQTMHGLAGLPEANELKETLDVWAVNMSSKIYQPFEHVRTKGHTRLTEGVEIAEPETEAVILRIVVFGVATELPAVRTEYPEASGPAARAAVVLALGQYFVDRNDLFAKELPLHVLAFRKYYADIRAPDDPASVAEAPLYAIQKALDYFNSVARGTMQ